MVAKPLFANLDAAGAKHLYFLIEGGARRVYSRGRGPVWGAAEKLVGLRMTVHRIWMIEGRCDTTTGPIG